jgi:hypothetical protein
MKPIKALLVLAVILAPGIAGAQGYYGGGGGGPLPGGFHNRMGRIISGVSIGVGGMHDDGSGITTCGNCNYNPAALELDGHIGGMISPRFALMAEMQVNAQTVNADINGANGDTVLSQEALMLAGQFWLTPQLWVKGGIGFAHLDAQDNYTQYDFGGGGAIMGGVGFELLSARFFAVDLQARLIEGSYHGLDDHITSGTIGVGLNWY